MSGHIGSSGGEKQARSRSSEPRSQPSALDDAAALALATPSHRSQRLKGGEPSVSNLAEVGDRACVEVPRIPLIEVPKPLAGELLALVTEPENAFRRCIACSWACSPRNG